MESSGKPTVAALDGLRMPAFSAALAELLSLSHTIKPSDLAATASAVMAPFGIGVVIYVVDYEQRALRALPGGSGRNPPTIMIDGSIAGRAFQTVSIVRAGSPPHRLWVPIVDGTARLGVLAVDLPDGANGSGPKASDPSTGSVGSKGSDESNGSDESKGSDESNGSDESRAEDLRALAGLLGHLLVAKGGMGDAIEAARRSTEMTVASELLLRLVPPSTFVCDELALSVVLEPSYSVGGDGYDYSVDGTVARVAVLDAAGHGMPAALTCAAALSAVRAARRAGRPLPALARAADAAITSEWDDARFATGVLVEIDLDTGRTRYLNAGHPPPALIRGGRLVELLDGGRRMPLGLDDEAPKPAELRLEPGDRLLLYTDGVTEARDEFGAFFGLDRLVALTDRHVASQLPTAEILRRLSHAVLDHQDGQLQDDATLMLIEWKSDSAARAVP